jgi:hypothetical protein
MGANIGNEESANWTVSISAFGLDDEFIVNVTMEVNFLKVKMSSTDWTSEKFLGEFKDFFEIHSLLLWLRIPYLTGIVN